MQEIKNKVAIVTGAGRGIGAAVAAAVAAAGARVAVNDLNPDRAERVAQQIRDASGTAVAIAADVSNKFQCVHLIETTRAAWGRLDLLVNNAAIKPRSPILKMDEWDWNRALEVNLKGPFFMSQLCGRVMAEADGGVIVNMGSAAEDLADHAAYTASKAGLLGFGRVCAREFAAHNIQVHTLLPPEMGGGENTAVLADTIAQTVLSLWASGKESSVVPLDTAVS